MLLDSAVFLGGKQNYSGRQEAVGALSEADHRAMALNRVFVKVPDEHAGRKLDLESLFSRYPGFKRCYHL